MTTPKLSRFSSVLAASFLLSASILIAGRAAGISMSASDTTAGTTSSYEDFPLNRRALAVLKLGKNLIPVHCRNTGGDQYIDFGFAEAKPAP